MLACSILLFVSTFASSVAIDYAGEACYDSLLSTCVESMILANKNTTARGENFNLSGCRLFGTIPDQLVDLVNDVLVASNVYLDSNQLTGHIPSILGSLSKVTTMFLDHNLLSGTIPASFGSLGSVDHLNFYENRLTGSLPASIGSLREMNGRLCLSYNQLSGVLPSSLGSMRNLNSFEAIQNTIGGTLPASLGSMIGMRDEFNLENNLITGTIPLSMGSLGQQLQVMRLNKNQLSGTVPDALMQSRSFSRGVNILRNAAPLADPPRDTCEQDPKLSHRQFQVLSVEPRIYYYPEFLSDAEVDAILEYAEKQRFNHGSIFAGLDRNIRRSLVHEIRYIDMPDVMLTVLKRISGEVKVPTNYFDRFQIQIYDAAVEDENDNTGGAFYGTHHDGLDRSATMILYLNTLTDDPNCKDDDESCIRWAHRGECEVNPIWMKRNCRLSCGVCTVEAGGETVFQEVMLKGSDTSQPLPDGATKEGLERLCADPRVLKVKPRRGSAVLFYSYTPEGVKDWNTMHGGCPVKGRRVKKIAQQWVHSIGSPNEHYPAQLPSKDNPS